MKKSNNIITRRKNKENKSTNCEFTLNCEWRNCTTIFTTLLEFCDHMIKHINELKISKDKYVCSWSKCHFSTSCNLEIARHIYYHPYHANLLLEGRKTIHKSNFPNCAVESNSLHQLPELNNDFECEWGECKKKFVSVILFHEHVRKHCDFEFESSKTPEVKKPIVNCNWRMCTKKFSVKYRLQEHLRKHTNEKLIACPTCGTTCRTKTVLFDHIKRQASNNTEEFQCGQCFKYFATERLLRLHIVVHVNCFKCSLCDMTCNTSFTLANHIRHRHMLEKPLKCSLCTYKCVTKSDLSRHILSKHYNKIYECTEIGCNYAVKTIHKLKKHFSKVHDNNPTIYACHCCDNVYNSGRVLSQHLIRNHSFQLPSGHKRFTYCMDEHGIYHLQTTRIESLEVTKQILSPKQNMEFNRIHENIKISTQMDDDCSEKILFSIEV